MNDEMMMVDGVKRGKNERFLNVKKILFIDSHKVLRFLVERSSERPIV